MQTNIRLFLFVVGLVLVLDSCSTTTRVPVEPGVVSVVYCIDTETDGFKYRGFSQSLNLNSFKRGNIVEQALSPVWRDSLTDSFGGSLKVSWFLMTFEGYRPSRYGVNAVAGEFLTRFSDIYPQLGDEVGWHYHHADWYQDSLSHRTGWNKINTFSGISYGKQTDRELAMSQLASFVYLNRLYPASFRSGWLWENTDFSNWLDSVVPFDYSNSWDAVDPELNIYHPSTHDLFVPGGLSRFVIRAPDDMDSTYIRSMFEAAAAGRPVILATYTHNFGSTVIRNNAIKNKARWFHRLCVRYSDSLQVPFRYYTASEAVNRANGIEMPSEYYLSVHYDSSDGSLYADCDSSTFGAPLVCLVRDDEISGSLMERDRDSDVWRLSLDATTVDSFLVGSVSTTGETFLWGPYSPRDANAQKLRR